MLIEGCLMQSLACVAADVANINSFSLLPLGLAWMTSLHFSLDESPSQIWRRSTLTSSTATLDATSADSTSTWQIDVRENKESVVLLWSCKWLLGWQFRGRSVIAGFILTTEQWEWHLNFGKRSYPTQGNQSTKPLKLTQHAKTWLK